MCRENALHALSETVATVSPRTEKILSVFRLRNKKCSETGPDRIDVVSGRNSTRNCSGSISTARIIYEVPRDTHAEPLLILLQLDHLGDRREQHMLRLVKSSVSGSSHPAMTLLFHQEPHGTVSVPRSRTALGKRRPSVVGAITFNQWSAFISDSEESDS